jgi:hypothetical protein
MANSPVANVVAQLAPALSPGLFDGQIPPPAAFGQPIPGDVELPVELQSDESGDVPLPGDAGVEVSGNAPTLLEAAPPIQEEPLPAQIDDGPLIQPSIPLEGAVSDPQLAGGPLTDVLKAGIKKLTGVDKFGAPPDPTLGDVIRPGDTSGLAERFVIVREATEDEIDEFNSLTGKTSGVPSPTAKQTAAGIPTAEFNLEQINGPDALKETVDKVAEMWKVNRKPMTFEETKELANEMGLLTVVNRLLRRQEGDAFSNVEITASLQAIATSAMELNRLAKIAARSTDSADLLRFRQHLAFQSALQTSMKGAQVEAGRALAAFRIPRGVGTDIQADSLQQIMEEFGGAKSVRDMAKDYLALPTQEARNRFTLGGWDKVKGAWFEIWINGLLSAVQTHLANITGNAGFQVLFQIPERFGAGLIGLARRAAGSKADAVELQETVADLIGLVQGIGDGFRLAAASFATEAPIRDVVGKVEAAQRRVITAANLGSDSDTFLGKGIDYVGTGIRLPGRFLMAEDEFFKAVAYRRELNALATRRAVQMKRNGATADDIQEEMENIFNGLDADINQKATEFSQVATFTNPVDGRMGQLGSAIQGTTLGRMLLPFFRTPVNIFKAAAERSPYGFIKAINNASDPIKRDILIARASYGTSAMGWAAYQYTQGTITGSGPSDHTIRRQMESLGWKRWSFVSTKEGVTDPRWIQVGHTYMLHPDDVDYVSYAKLEPASMLLAVAADIAERFRFPIAEQEEIQDLIMSGLDTIFSYTTEQTFMKGIANIAKLISAGTGAQRDAKISQLTQDLIGSQMPFSSLLASIERVMDPLQDSIIPDRNEPLGLRDLYAGLKRMDGRIPLTETGGPLLRDRFGNPRLQKGVHVRDVLLPPFMADILGEDSKKIQADPVMLEVVAAGVPLTNVPRKIDGVKLTAEEYDAFVRFAANPPIDGVLSFYEALEDLFELGAYQDASTADKQTLIQGTDSDYKKIAKTLLLDDENFEEQFANLRAKVEQHRAIIENVGRQIQ